MYGVRTLIESYWINKVKDRELYNKTKREINNFRRFIIEQLGWRLINNERILKIEKIPANAQPYMGITEFREIRDYCILCTLLIFLEDKEDDEQFLLSELIDMIEVHMREFMEIDWTIFSHRKSLIRVLKFAEDKGLLAVYEGSSDNLSNDIKHEVLYENTGLSRYFATNFDYDISKLTSYKDFEKEHLKGVAADRGHFRINKVYRQIITEPAMYWSESDDQHAIYLKNHRQWIQKNLSENLGGHLHIHKNAAFFLIEEEEFWVNKHPRDTMLSELVLSICNECRNRIEEGVWQKESDEVVYITRVQFRTVLRVVREKYEVAWTSEFRKLGDEKLINALIKYMEDWMLLKNEKDRIILYPAVGKFIGNYPKDFNKGGT